MQNQLHHAYARTRVQDTVAEAARRHVEDTWTPKGSRPVAADWEAPATTRRLLDRISFSEVFVRATLAGEAN